MIYSIFNYLIKIECNIDKLINIFDSKYKIVNVINGKKDYDYEIEIVFCINIIEHIKKLNPIFDKNNKFTFKLNNIKYTILLVKNKYIIKEMKKHKTRIYFNCIDQIEFIEDCVQLTILNFIQNKIDSIIIHSSCVVYNDNTIILSGPSGSGKSTLAALAYLNGYQIIENENLIINIKEPVCFAGVSKNITLKSEGKDLLYKYLNSDNILDNISNSIVKNIIFPKNIYLVYLNYTNNKKCIEIAKFDNILNDLKKQVIIPEGYFDIDKIQMLEYFYKLLSVSTCFYANLEKNNIKKSESILQYFKSIN